MCKKSLTFLLYVLGLISQVSLMSYDKKSADFKMYTINVLNHIRVKTGWYSMSKLQFTQGTFKFDVNNVINEVIDERNYIAKLNYIIHLINCEYSNILQTFDVMLSFIINKCQSEKDKNHQIQFQYCTMRLVDVIKNSSIMFMKLLGATTFLSQLDLRIIDEFLINPRVIDNEIELFYMYTDDKMNRPEFVNENDIIDVFEDIKKFHKNIVEPTIQKLFEFNKVCGSRYRNVIPMVLMSEYDEKNINEIINDPDDYINLICNDLNNFYSRIVDNYYRDLGFGDLVGTNNFRYELRDHSYNMERGIELFNKLLQYPGWQSYQHVTTNINGLNVSVKDLICFLNISNYSYVRSSIIQTLRCRYIEIGLTFNAILGAIISVCDKEYENEFAAKLYTILEKVNLTLKNMLFALVTLRQTLRSIVKRKRHTTSELLIESIIQLICKLRSKYYPDMFYSSHSSILSKSFFSDITQERKENINDKIKLATKYHLRYCKTPLKVINELAIKLKFHNQIQINNELDNRNFFESLCGFLYTFCNEVQTNDYEKLGFDSLSRRF
ncbi:uncharacterized protein LOC126902247 [Daktulosphaira vitifoliae]|uniref:uncharacterized protein LOC126902247 n=1 Tax=Daktulosphaira vitifoliae TaxID=58002 RepID=UPI0021AAABD3|nr:uncharacterized protein LOC126902247 [Daktulosphaira vitifoliae]